ncbi:MAG: tRNA guanosine(34) transglycosylase Tgt [Myxococcota bacterium]|nr:tRNA guanosine(34) transglycosylase Tgt [Myxococcota bacterium]
MKFELHATAPGSRARAGTLTTAHGTIDTPIFMPVGTRATVRTQPLSVLEQLAPPIVLANTYHLLLSPGIDVFEQVGGLHRWMGWSRAILTDSGGFQVFSLERAVHEAGAEIEVGGAKLLLTPERSIAMQRAIGSDIMMVLDHCIASTSPHAAARTAMELTHRWAARSLAARGDSPQALFAIVQGACFPDLRRDSAHALTSIAGFDGFAIGGLAVGETRAQREDITELVTAELPADRPRYLMGVGMPIDLLEAVHRGVDMFDCTLPTVLAQQGIAFTSHGKLDLRRGVYKLAERALDAACSCEACTRHSRSYLRHLVKTREPLGWQLLATHNLRYYLELARTMRARILDGSFMRFHAEQRTMLARTDDDNPSGPRPRVRPPVAPPTRGAFAIHPSPAGFASIRHLPSGEIMHSVNDPDLEARRVYIEPSTLVARALAGVRPIVVWDVGLGAAHNAMALVRVLDATPAHAPVELVSFEHDLDALRLALDHTKQFAHLRHPAPHLLAHHGAYARANLTWALVPGDFLATFAAAPQPDVIFYDPFSSKTDTTLWTLATFRALRAHLAKPVELFTYSSSTAVRSSLLAAGFHVARGVASGPKPETTIALIPGDPAFACHPLLGRAWLERRARSTAPFGTDVPSDQHPDLERAIRTHAQFA